MAEQPPGEFERNQGGNIFSDFWYFLLTNKKWWMIPLLVVLLLLSALMFISTTGIAPFIYTIF